MTSIVTTADTSGNRNSERMLATGPNGDTAMRSKVPATSSWRTVVGTSSVDCRTWRMITPTAA